MMASFNGHLDESAGPEMHQVAQDPDGAIVQAPQHEQQYPQHSAPSTDLQPTHQQDSGASAFSELAAPPWTQPPDEGHFTILNPQHSLDGVPIFPRPASDFSMSPDPYASSQSHSSSEADPFISYPVTFTPVVELTFGDNSMNLDANAMNDDWASFMRHFGFTGEDMEPIMDRGAVPPL